jgi:hypothetical protein
MRSAMEAIVCQHLSVGRVAEGLGVSWYTANNAVLAEGQRVLIEDPVRFDGVRVIGVDEHVWRHTRRGDQNVTVIMISPRSAIRPARPGCSTWWPEAIAGVAIHRGREVLRCRVPSVVR